MVLQLGQSVVPYWELGHRSGMCGMEDNVMSTLRTALAVWGLIYFLLSLLRPAAPTLMGQDRVRALTCSSSSQTGTAVERLCPADYTKGNASHLPHTGHRHLILITYRMATFHFP